MKNNLIRFNKLLFFLFLFTTIYFQSSCSNVGEWGLQKILFKHQLEFKSEQYIREIIYNSNLSSERFELRLFFPQLSLIPLESKDEINSIRKLLDGFEYSFYDITNDSLVTNYKFDIDDKKTRYNSNYNQPFSIWLRSSIQIESGNAYKIILSFPLTKNIDEKFTQPVLVGGISKKILL